MSESDDVERARRRAVVYWFVDGLPELAFGGVLVATAAVLAAAAIVGPDGSGAVMAVGLPLALVVGVPAAGRWVRKHKRRSTYPRTGRVLYGPAGRWRRAAQWALLAAMTAGVAWVAWREAGSMLIAAGVTALVAGFLVTIGLRTGLRRFSAAAAVTVLALIASSGVLPDVEAVLSSVLGVTGLLILRNGAAARMRYQREAPDPDGSAGT